ncbi:MAG: M23 family metallopeptidase [Clostridia bacterium]|nr:M23 family metallopeptidase [Clostridia bacterium]
MKIPFISGKCKLTSPFGQRVLNGKTEGHSGYDLVGVGSTEVCAVAGGKVIQSRMITDKSNLTWQWGNYVCVQGYDNTLYYYCHLKSRAVEVGRIVSAGDVLGVMGNTGYSLGAHLHLEVRRGGKAVCPEGVTGIPNKVGVYEVDKLDAALSLLQEKGVTNSPDYWKKTAPSVKYLPELLVKIAEKLR